MGEKADKLNIELVPTRSLLRRIADRLGVVLEETITADNVRRYERTFMEAIRRRNSQPDSDTKTFDEVIDEAIDEAAEQGTLAAIGHADRPNALAKRSDITTEFDQDANDQAVNIELIQQIAKMVGADAADLDSIRIAIERVMGEGGDIEVPKGDTLAEAMRHGHEQNHVLRDRIKDARLLVQRIANALQIIDWKPDGDGAEVMQAIQRIETGKVMLRRRIMELRRIRAGQVLGPAIADELEHHYVRMLSPHEAAEWSRKGATTTRSPVETSPHPFVFDFTDISRLQRSVGSVVAAYALGGERSRLSELHGVMEEIERSPEAAAHLVSAMETILVILAKERAANLKE